MRTDNNNNKTSFDVVQRKGCVQRERESRSKNNSIFHIHIENFMSKFFSFLWLFLVFFIYVGRFVFVCVCSFFGWFYFFAGLVSITRSKNKKKWSSSSIVDVATTTLAMHCAHNKNNPVNPIDFVCFGLLKKHILCLRNVCWTPEKCSVQQQ